MAAGKAVPEDKRGALGYTLRMGESAGRGTTNLLDAAIEAPGYVAARIANAIGAEDHEKRIRAGLRVGRDLRRLEQGVIDPIRSYSEG